MDKSILNRIFFKIMILVAVMVTAIPYLHDRVGGYVKFILLYGLVIIACEIITKRSFSLLKDKMSIILIFFSISYFITVFVNRDLNFSSNIKALVYMLVFFVLLYMSVQDRTTRDLVKEVELISAIVLVGTFILSLACFMMFALSISGEYRISSGIMYYGMYDHRLWGVYNANTGSTLNCISIILSMTFLTKPRKNIYKVFIIVNLILQYICLLLTGSRAALYMLLGILVIVTIITCIKKYHGSANKLRLIIISVVTSGIIIGTFLACNSIVKEAVAYVPSVVNVIRNTFSEQKNDEIEIEKYDLERLEEVENREGGFFTGRTDLWQASLQAFKESPIFGITRENIYEKAEVFLEDDLWAKNLRVGGTHNIYICILVSSGIIGFILLAIFMIYTMLNSLLIIVRNFNRINTWMVSIFLLMIMFLVTEFVEARILYQVNVFNVLFWIYCGYMASFLQKMKKEEIVNESTKETLKQ